MRIPQMVHDDKRKQADLPCLQDIRRQPKIHQGQMQMSTELEPIIADDVVRGKTYYEKQQVDEVIAKKDHMLEYARSLTLANIINGIAKLKDALRWREFSEEKPEHHQRILVCSRDYKTELRRWDEDCKFDVEVQEIYTHWMPLPKEPEE
jgi:hypothetical protein